MLFQLCQSTRLGVSSIQKAKGTENLKFHEMQIVGGALRFYKLFEPVHEILVLVTSASSQGSDKTVPLHSLTRAFASRIHKVLDL